MEQRIRASLAYSLYKEGLTVEEITAHFLPSVPKYDIAQTRYDLWSVARAATPFVPPFAYDPVADEDVNDPCRRVCLGIVARAYEDLARGAPCVMTWGALSRPVSYCHTTMPPRPNWKHYEVDHNPEWVEEVEAHSCAEDAYAWLTSWKFYQMCQALDWEWCSAMNAVLRVAGENASLFPFVVLTPALVWRIACVLQGEAAGLGVLGFYEVGDTMLSRRAQGETWEVVLSAYYGYAQPSEEAMAMAARILLSPWPPSGRLFAYTNADRLRMGWPQGDKVLQANGQTLHLATSVEEQ